MPAIALTVSYSCGLYLLGVLFGLVTATEKAGLSPALHSDDECIGPEGSCELSAVQRRSLAVRNREVPLSNDSATALHVSNTSNITLPASACASGRQIPFSNRGPGNECFASSLGDECEYACNDGYIGVGRHVCQTIYIENEAVQVWKNSSFFGGNCWRLCSDSPTCTGQVPLRVNSSDSMGPCMKTTCFATPKDAFMNVARGNYEIWKLARDEVSGCYADHVDLDTQEAHLGSSDSTGMGLVMECVADAMGWISREEFLKRINRTLSSYAGIPPPNQTWNFKRGPRGRVPRFYDIRSGDLLAEGTEEEIGKTWSVMSTGLFYSGVLFAQTYLENIGANKKSPLAGYIIDLAARMMNMVQWSSMMCFQAFNSTAVVEGYNGTGIPFLMDSDGHCQAIMWPEADGYYPFNEEITADWIATEVVCFQKNQVPCSRPAMIEMWKRVIGRASHPNVKIDGYDILSDWAAYVVQLPYYTVNVVNSNPVFQQMFKNGWLADWADYNSSVFYGGSNRYGMGAGPDMTWCSGATYFADKYTMDPKKAKCRTWSPYSVAGWLPAAPDTIQGHLLEMLWTGESVLNYPGTDYHILWRKSLIDPAMNWSSYVTTIDIAGELFGLSTLFLGVDFYREHSNHFTKKKGFMPITEPGDNTSASLYMTGASRHLSSKSV